MKDKSPERVLYELEHFGVPTRDWSLEEAQKLIEQGLLSQKQVDEASKKYQDRIGVESLRKYGTATPTEKQTLDYALKLIDRGRKKIEAVEVPTNFVNMYSGKYSSGERLYTSGLGGCIATLLYFENQEARKGVMTHYPPLNIDENIQRLRELRDTHLKGDYQKQRGVVLAERPNKASQLLETGIRAIFPEITLDTIVYDQTRVGKVSLNPSKSEWQTEQHGRNSF